MPKRQMTPIPSDVPSLDKSWLDLDRVAVVEVTSEEKEYPVEAAFGAEEMQGWRVADSGAQTIRLIFDQPQRLKRIALVFEESETERTQEFVLAMVSRQRALVSRNCAPAMEFQSSSGNT